MERGREEGNGEGGPVVEKEGEAGGAAPSLLPLVVNL